MNEENRLVLGLGRWRFKKQALVSEPFPQMACLLAIQCVLELFS